LTAPRRHGFSGERDEAGDRPHNPHDHFIVAAIQPAGDYILDTDDELIEGLSRLAYRRVATLLHLPSTSLSQGRAELLSVSPAELDAALEKDRIARVE
jgi:hypothetical protein